MKKLFTFVLLLVAVLCITTVSAQYSNGTLSGAWLARNFNPDTYMIFDGNGTVLEMGVYYDHVATSSIGTYSVTTGGVLSGSISMDGQVHPLTGQFINTDSVSGIQTGGSIPGTLSRISNPGLLAGNWTGSINNLGAISFTVNSTGGISAPTNLTGHIFSKYGQLVGFITNIVRSDCWNKMSFSGSYTNGTMTGTSNSDCHDTSGAFYMSQSNSNLINYNVTVPTGTNACYITGDMNSWSFTPMNKTDNTHYTITLSSSTSNGYKYCSSPSLNNVEVDASGNDLPNNRTYSPNDVVVRWKSVNITAYDDLTAWNMQTNPLGNGNDSYLGKLQFVSATEGWIACGGNGSLLHTTNGGATWNIVNPFPADIVVNMSNPGLSMSWVNPTHGWAIKSYCKNDEGFENSNGALIYKTSDGGSNWTKKELPKFITPIVYTSGDLTGTWKFNALITKDPSNIASKSGWMYGDVVISSSGNFSASIINNYGVPTTRILQISVTTRAKIVVDGKEVGFMSADKKTIIITAPEQDDSPVLYIIEKQNTAVSYSTTDIQGSWQMNGLSSGTDTGDKSGYVHGLVTADASGNLIGTLTGVGNSQIPLNTTVSISSTGIIGGFSSVSSNSKGFMSADKKTMVIVMTDNVSAYNLLVFQKQNAGTVYQQTDLAGIWQLHALVADNTNDTKPWAGWLTCQMNIKATGAVTMNNVNVNGANQNTQTDNIYVSTGGIISGFDSKGDGYGFMSSDKSMGVFTNTHSSGGYTFAVMQKDLSVSGDFGMQVQFADENTGWASCYNMIYENYFMIYKTTDGGDNWNLITGPNNPVGGFYHFKDANNGWLIGANDVTEGGVLNIFHTTNGGLSWELQASNIGSSNAIYMIDLMHGWVVGKNGLIMNTTDGGSHWNNVTNAGIEANSNSKSVFFLDANNGWITNESQNWMNGQSVLHTTDGGASWSHQNPGYSNGSMFSIFFWDKNNGWISGEQNTNPQNPNNYAFKGVITHTTGATDIPETKVQNDLTLFPNPVTDRLNIQTNQSIQSTDLMNITGTVVKRFGDTNMLSLSDIQPGVYVIKITFIDNQCTIKRIIKQ